jgi:hypothetical protein
MKGKRKLTGLRLCGTSLRLIVLGETGNEIGFVAGVRKAPLGEQLLQLGDLHGVVVGHDGCGCAAAAQSRTKRDLRELGCNSVGSGIESDVLVDANFDGCDFGGEVGVK